MSKSREVDARGVSVTAPATEDISRRSHVVFRSRFRYRYGYEVRGPHPVLDAYLPNVDGNVNQHPRKKPFFFFLKKKNPTNSGFALAIPNVEFVEKSFRAPGVFAWNKLYLEIIFFYKLNDSPLIIQ